MKKNLDIRDIVFAGVSARRAADNLKVRHQPRGGLTTYSKRRVASISAPMTKGAQARTVRIHELLHANRSPISRSKKFHPIARNAIEDARVHAVYWPDGMPERANRDCLATALADMRTLRPMADLATADDWNLALLIALRSMAIIDRLGSSQHANRLAARTAASFGALVHNELCNILDLVKRNKKTKALKAFSELMRSDDDEEKDDSHGGQKGNGSTGKQSANPMRVVRLPMPAATNSKAKRTALARSGARLNRGRLARAVATGSTAGLFIRPRYLPGGTYLFDASGSMGLSEERLNELCQSVPAATAAYYSGNSPDASGCYGELVIYAENNRRAVECERVYGGNEVDLFAIQWLLKQPGPRVFVCDGGFCGGPNGQDIAAAKLIASAVASGAVVWFQSIADLEKALGKTR